MHPPTNALQNEVGRPTLPQVEAHCNRRARIVTRYVIACGGLMLATLLDGTIATFLKTHGIDRWIRWTPIWNRSPYIEIGDVMKVPGGYRFALACAIFAVIFHRSRWSSGLFVLLGAALSSVNAPLKWIVGRLRPFKSSGGSSDIEAVAEPFDIVPFRGGFDGLVNEANLCFPSGHATLAYATAAAMSLLFPQLRWLFFGLATITAAERVLENAHWFSDVIGAAILGIGGVHALDCLLNRPTRSPKPDMSATENIENSTHS